MPKFVITGASGGGKSTLINALSNAGHATVSEAGRQIVTEQMASNGSALPWMDRIAFMDLLFERSIAAFDTADTSSGQAVFFDRSFIEAIAYGAVIGRDPLQSMLEAAAERRFENPVFVCPPWPEIFARDAERRHDLDFAIRDYEANVAAYSASGYELTEIPRVSVEERVAFIARRLSCLPKPRTSNPAKKLYDEP